MLMELRSITVDTYVSTRLQLNEKWDQLYKIDFTECGIPKHKMAKLSFMSTDQDMLDFYLYVDPHLPSHNKTPIIAPKSYVVRLANIAATNPLSLVQEAIDDIWTHSLNTLPLNGIYVANRLMDTYRSFAIYYFWSVPHKDINDAVRLWNTIYEKLVDPCCRPSKEALAKIDMSQEVVEDCYQINTNTMRKAILKIAGYDYREFFNV